MLESCKSEGSVSLPSLYSNCLTRAEEKYVYFLGYWAFTVGHNRSGGGVFGVFPCLGEGAVLGDRSIWHSKPLGFHKSTAALETPAGLGCLCYRNSGHVHFPLTATAHIFSSHFFPIPTWLVFFCSLGWFLLTHLRCSCKLWDSFLCPGSPVLQQWLSLGWVPVCPSAL